MRLELVACYNLTHIAPLVQCTKLQHLRMIRCNNISDMHELTSMGSLTSLSVDDTYQLPPLPRLTSLYLFGRLGGLGVAFHLFQGLTTVTLDSTGLPSLMGIRACGRLRELTLKDCASMSDIGELEECTELERLTINSCPRLTRVCTTRYQSLQRLRIDRCWRLTTVEAEGCPRLTSVKLFDCPEITVCNLRRNPALSEVNVAGCDSLSSPRVT